MAKGKKYAKWYAKHFKEIEARKQKPKQEVQGGMFCMPVDVVENGELIKGDSLKHPVHGYFIYECERCGAVYQMYLDKGLEDSLQDRYYPDKHKPVPFTIMCRECAQLAETLGRKELYGFCRHILWGIGDSETYEELPEGASYFKNDPNEPHGIPVCNTPYRNREAWQRAIMAKRFDGIGGRFG